MLSVREVHRCSLCASARSVKHPRQQATEPSSSAPDRTDKQGGVDLASLGSGRFIVSVGKSLQQLQCRASFALDIMRYQHRCHSSQDLDIREHAHPPLGDALSTRDTSHLAVAATGRRRWRVFTIVSWHSFEIVGPVHNWRLKSFRECIKLPAPNTSTDHHQIVPVNRFTSRKCKRPQYVLSVITSCQRFCASHPRLPRSYE